VVPTTIDDDDRRALRACFSPAHEEWIVLSIAMMGWLNKTMDALGVPLEEPTVAEVQALITPSGWSAGKHVQGQLPTSVAAPAADSLGKRLGVIRHAPKAVGFDKAWTQGVPDRWPAVGAFLRENTGHDFPVLGRLQHRGPVRAIATMIRDNFCQSVVGREVKLAAGLLHAEAVHDASLAEQLRAAGAKPCAESAVHVLARAASPSPAAVDAEVVAACRELAPAAIVEVVTFIALLQLLHRLESYYAA
jgi:hypothetical protein